MFGVSGVMKRRAVAVAACLAIVFATSSVTCALPDASNTVTGPDFIDRYQDIWTWQGDEPFLQLGFGTADPGQICRLLLGNSIDASTVGAARARQLRAPWFGFPISKTAVPLRAWSWGRWS